MNLAIPAIYKFLIPAVGCLIIFLRFGKRDILAPALFWPPARQVALWCALALAWMLGTDFLVNWRGPFDFAPWQAQPLMDSVFRVLGVAVFGPAMEELIFRGFMFGRLLKTPLGAAGTIVATAAVWAAIHWDYSPLVIGIIFIQGLLLGLARWRTGSVFLPIVMHCLWNLYAVW
ncbi:CPBP family intramembrane metalloprotease [Sphingomonas sinipercae]|uniref:CPBP family intramembrane metalloprotease n=1 Tax=Sphingomonas sinipercae TaxID=2714944 RepID=A0A6G7ZKU8_9SPHN|nr:CPBP family intramembrane glutamic endopeptidase [Sphingomonas sinipercae]QIL01526.1 CPBP family intramembrane metalloprotease [Sphingomonas sinipercae]